MTSGEGSMEMSFWGGSHSKGGTSPLQRTTTSGEELMAMGPHGGAAGGEKRPVSVFPPLPPHLEKTGCRWVPSPWCTHLWGGSGGLKDHPVWAAVAVGPGRAWGFAGVPEAGGVAPAPRGTTGADGNGDAVPGCCGPSCPDVCSRGGTATPWVGPPCGHGGGNWGAHGGDPGVRDP